VDYLASGNADLSLFDTPVGVQLLYEDFVDWFMNDDIYFTPNQVINFKSAVSTLLNATFDTKVAEKFSNKLIAKGFRRVNCRFLQNTRYLMRIYY
jgi:hypothetical protein